MIRVNMIVRMKVVMVKLRKMKVIMMIMMSKRM